MFCPKCGSQVGDKNQYCRQCGGSVTTETPPASQQRTASPSNSHVDTKWRFPLSAGLGVAALVVAIASLSITANRVHTKDRLKFAEDRWSMHNKSTVSLASLGLRTLLRSSTDSSTTNFLRLAKDGCAEMGLNSYDGMEKDLINYIPYMTISDRLSLNINRVVPITFLSLTFAIISFWIAFHPAWGSTIRHWIFAILLSLIGSAIITGGTLLVFHYDRTFLQYYCPPRLPL